jgi:DNA invertase Pin-like site-specific DNA recombinase
MKLGYGRGSTDGQGEALQAQITRLEQAGCDRVISELLSGLDNERPGLLEAMALVKSGQVKEPLLTRIDRLGRDAAYADQLIGLCTIHGVTIRALDGGLIETASPHGFFMARTMTSLAEMESRMLSMRLKKQFAVYRTQGRHLRGSKPFGYMGGPDHQLIPDPEHWGQAQRVLERLRALGSFSRVANELPSWCPWTPAAGNVQYWFVSPALRGHLAFLRDRKCGKGWNMRWGQIYYDQHEPLIREEEWQELAMFLRQTKNNFDGRLKTSSHGLTGLLYCACCGHRLRRNLAGTTPWWRCRHRLCNERGGISEHRALALVAAACVEAAGQLASIADEPQAEHPGVAIKRRDLEELQRLATRNPALDGSVAALKREIEAMTRQKPRSLKAEVYEQMMRDPAFFSEATAEEQRALFGGVLQGVRVGPRGNPFVPIVRSF